MNNKVPNMAMNADQSMFSMFTNKYVLGAIAVLVVALVAYMYFKKKKAVKFAEPDEVVVKPDVVQEQKEEQKEEQQKE